MARYSPLPLFPMTSPRGPIRHNGKSITMNEALARGWEDLISRWGGPMSFRLLMQPAVAILFAIRAGVKDARQHEPPFLWDVLTNPRGRQERLRQVWKDVGKVFVVALILDSIYQVVVHAGIFTLELLITATVLALIPYIILRGLVTRIARCVGVGKQPVPRTASEESAK